MQTTTVRRSALKASSAYMDPLDAVNVIASRGAGDDFFRIASAYRFVSNAAGCPVSASCHERLQWKVPSTLLPCSIVCWACKCIILWLAVQPIIWSAGLLAGFVSWGCLPETGTRKSRHVCHRRLADDGDLRSRHRSVWAVVESTRGRLSLPSPTPDALKVLPLPASPRKSVLKDTAHALPGH